MENPEEYLPILIEVEGVIAEELPLVGGVVVSAMAEKILGALQSKGALVDLSDFCWCGDPAIFGANFCPNHIHQED